MNRQYPADNALFQSPSVQTGLGGGGGGGDGGGCSVGEVRGKNKGEEKRRNTD